MKSLFAVASVLLLLAGANAAPNATDRAAAPTLYLWSAEKLAAARERVARDDESLRPAIAKLRADANQALTSKPMSVMDKTRLPPSGDKHDYLSQAPYWWPDPARPDGKPYLRKDGERNPEIERGTDRAALRRLEYLVQSLTLAYFFTREERYAEHAAKLLRTWFVDPATRMNPHLEYAQGIPGHNTGRGIGMIETARLGTLCDCAALLAASPAWTSDLAGGFRDWIAAYFKWATTSRHGQEESNEENNHGTWYDVQTAHFALFLGKHDTAREILQRGLKKRLEFQIEPDGAQPRELARTKSLSYSTMNLDAMFNNARLAEHVGIDWWNHRSADGRSLRAALEYIAPYADQEKAWRKKDLIDADRDDILYLVARGVQHWNAPELLELLTRHGGKPSVQAARWRLLLNR